MVGGISSYPKHFLLILLSDVTEMLHHMGKTVVSDDLKDSEKVRIFEELLLAKEAAFTYLTVNKIMEKLCTNEEEMRNIKAELKLHMDTHQESYKDIHSLIADKELEDLLSKTGLTTKKDDSNKDNS